MSKTTSFDKMAYELRKLISILEWDIPNIQNNQLKAIKEMQLLQYKRKLQELLEKNELLV